MENAYAQLKYLFQQLPSGIGGQVWVIIGALFAGIFSIIWIIEKVCRTRTDNYRSLNFCHDLGYWFYNRSGMNYWADCRIGCIFVCSGFRQIF